MKRIKYFFIQFFLIALCTEAFAQIPLPSAACTPKESWVFPESFNSDFKESFEDNLLSSDWVDSVSKLSKFRSHKDPQIRSFAQYWTARSFQIQNQVFVSFRIYQNLIAGYGKSTPTGVWLAALDCARVLQEQIPNLEIEPAAVTALLSVPVDRIPVSHRSVYYRALLSQIKKSISEQKIKEANEILSRISESALEYSEAKVWILLYEKKFSDAAILLEKILSQPRPDADALRLLQSQAYFSVGNYNKTIAVAQKIIPTSNMMPSALVTMAWGYLQLKDYGNALAKAVSLQVGPLRKAFSPESPAISGIAFYEICQYPESQKATQLFRHLYGASFRWLTEWDKKVTQEKKTVPYYDLTVKALKGEDPGVPDPIVTEWIRDRRFLATQAELNAVIDAKTKILEFAKEHKESSSDPDEAKAIRLIKGTLKSEFKVLKAKAPILVRKIDQILTVRTREALNELKQAADNVKLLEIDLYNRASDDIIFRSTHPEFAEYARKAKVQGGKSKTPTMDWGGVDAHDSNSIEVWDDEIGQLNSQLPNICNEKKQFIQDKKSIDQKDES